MWRPVVESAWLSLPAPVWLYSSKVSASLLVALSSLTGVSISYNIVINTVHVSNDALLKWRKQRRRRRSLIHTRMRITGRFKGCFLSVHMVICEPQEESCLLSCSSLPRLSRRMSWSTKSPAPVKLPKLIARPDGGCLAPCTL